MSGIREQLGNLFCAVSMAMNMASPGVIKAFIDREAYLTAGLTFAGLVVYDALAIAGCCYASGFCSSGSNQSGKHDVRIMPSPGVTEAAVGVETSLLVQQTTGYGAV